MNKYVVIDHQGVEREVQGDSIWLHDNGNIMLMDGTYVIGIFPSDCHVVKISSVIIS